MFLYVSSLFADLREAEMIVNMSIWKSEQKKTKVRASRTSVSPNQITVYANIILESYPGPDRQIVSGKSSHGTTFFFLLLSF